MKQLHHQRLLNKKADTKPQALVQKNFIGVFVTLTLIISVIAITIYFKHNKSTLKQQTTIAVLNPVHHSTPQPSPSPNASTKEVNNSSNFQPTLASGFCLNVPVLMYHHVQPESQAKTLGQTGLTVDSNVFAKQMAYLASKGYNTITADQLAQALRSKDYLATKTAVLTFDDGYSDFYAYAFPVIKQYNLKANLMIPTGLIQNSDYMTWGQLKDIASSGNGKIYNHTWSHASLGKATTQKIDFEISTANKEIGQYIGTAPDIFSYPYGTASANVVSYLTQHGFIAAFSTLPGTWQCDSYIMSLHRTRIGNSSLATYGL